MGFSPFSPDYSKPGHGRIVDDSVYPPFIRFWKRYGRNFLKLIQLNMVYALVTMPIYVWFTSLINAASTQADGGVMTILGSVLLSLVIDLPAAPLVILVVISILLMGPATAAMSFCALDCAWDRPGLFWASFREAWKENWKQALPFGITDTLVCFVTLYYLVDGTAEFGKGLVIAWMVLALLYAMVRVYIYPIMVTVELSLGALIQNSLILVLLEPWRPLLVVAIALVLALLSVAVDVVLVPYFLYSFVAFTAAFVTEPIIKKHLLKPDDNRGEATAE